MKKQNIIILKDEEELRGYFDSHPEVNSRLIIEHTYYQPIDLGNIEYFNFVEIILDFHPYNKLYLLRNPIDNKIYLGDINLAGHGASFRVLKIKREEVFNKPEELSSWYNNFAEKIWML